MKYEVLLIDADDTLFDYSMGEEYALRKTLIDSNILYPFEKVLEEYKVINTGIWKEFEQGRIKVDELKILRFARLFERIGVEADSSRFSDDYLENLSEATFLIDGVEELVEQSYSDFKLAIITNGLTKVQRPRFNSSAIGKYFDEYIVSEEVGLQKPDPEIFSYALSKLKHEDKDSVLMIGDNPGSDILGGINFGIDTCWYNPGNKEPVKGIFPTYTINDIRELRSLIYSK